MIAELLAERILNAAGTRLHNYMPSSKARIIAEAEKIIQELTGPKVFGRDLVI